MPINKKDLIHRLKTADAEYEAATAPEAAPEAEAAAPPSPPSPDDNALAARSPVRAHNVVRPAPEFALRRPADRANAAERNYVPFGSERDTAANQAMKSKIQNIFGKPNTLEGGKKSRRKTKKSRTIGGKKSRKQRKRTTIKGGKRKRRRTRRRR